jgi:hypothetical protein
MSEYRINEKDLFVPVKNKDLRKTYPELAGVKEFDGLKTLDVKFCWYYSVFYHDESDHKKRIAQSINQSYRDSIDEAYRKELLKGNFTDQMRKAIRKFDSFDIGSRIRAKFIAERQLDAFEKLSNTDVNNVGLVKVYGEEGDEAIGEKRDWNQVNAFVSAMTKINESIPELLKNVEQSYGVRTKKDVTMVTSARDDFVQHEDLKKSKS